MIDTITNPKSEEEHYAILTDIQIASGVLHIHCQETIFYEVPVTAPIVVKDTLNIIDTTDSIIVFNVVVTHVAPS